MHLLHVVDQAIPRPEFAVEFCFVNYNLLFLRQIVSEGGSVTLLINRGSASAPFLVRRALARLAELKIDLEVD